jgi:uncharacterized protein (DUF58 family)
VETSELLKKIRAIEIRTRGLSNQIFSGEYHSAFKGRGMAFRENREYQHGDEIRTIDWNVTARMGHPFVKVFEEERELTAVILADVSASGEFGSSLRLKRRLIAEIAAVLSFSAIQNNDKAGVILFSEQIEKFIPPKKGKTHILRIISELLQFEPKHKGTNIAHALEYLSQAIKKRCIVFVLSDFLDTDFERALSVASRKHDLIAIRVRDRFDKELPALGIIRVADKETGEWKWINTSSASQRKKFAAKVAAHDAQLKELFRKSGVDIAEVDTSGDYVKPLMNLFKRRS